ncbi:hypothetical protein AC249_AIPGENE2100 [Exaiptasia diaphana]|nr:hypothetical protein AC249_AIPGENE2100 [Exaiptasia diaphana]
MNRAIVESSEDAIFINTYVKSRRCAFSDPAVLIEILEMFSMTFTSNAKRQKRSRDLLFLSLPLQLQRESGSGLALPLPVCRQRDAKNSLLPYY